MDLIKGKIPLVVFSGGFDSTAMLFSMLTKYAEVDVMMADLVGQTSKVAREKVAREKVLAQLEKVRKKHPNYMGVIRSKHEISVNGYMSARAIAPLAQGSSWIAEAVKFITRETDIVCIGYVKGDDGIASFAHFQKAWEHLLDAAGLNAEGSHRPRLEAPLMWYTKKSILEWTHSNSFAAGIFKYASWCEGPQVENDCGVCSSCTRMMEAINTWKTFEPDAYQRLSPYKGRFATMMRNLARSKKPYAIKPGDIAEIKAA